MQLMIIQFKFFEQNNMIKKKFEIFFKKNNLLALQHILVTTYETELIFSF